MIKPDLDHHTLIRFLDKFAFKAPKTSDLSRGVSIMQPRIDTQGQAFDSRLNSSRAVRSSTVNSPSFWNRKVEDIAAEDVFFHRYFSQAPNQRKMNGTADKTRDRSNSPDKTDDDEAEEEIWKALVSKQHDGDGENDQDPDISGLEESFDYDDSEEEDGQMDRDDDLEEQAFDDDDDSIDLLAGDTVDAADIKDGVKSQPRQSHGKDARRSLKGLATFASAEDYEALLAGEEVT